MIADFLYELVPKELLGAPVLERFVDFRTVTSALITNAHVWRVAGDRVCMLCSLFPFAVTAGVATIANTVASVRDLSGNTLLTMHAKSRYPTDRSDDGALNTNNTHQNVLTTPIWLMPNEELVVQAVYTAALAGNNLEAYVMGWMLPRGNVQLGSLPRV